MVNKLGRYGDIVLFVLLMSYIILLHFEMYVVSVALGLFVVAIAMVLCIIASFAYTIVSKRLKGKLLHLREREQNQTLLSQVTDKTNECYTHSVSNGMSKKQFRIHLRNQVRDEVGFWIHCLCSALLVIGIKGFVLMFVFEDFMRYLITLLQEEFFFDRVFMGSAYCLILGVMFMISTDSYKYF